MADDEKPWTVYDVVQWTYKRGAIGDIEIWARTKEEVLATLVQHGFTNADPDRIVQSSEKRTLADVLKKTTESEGL